MLKFYLNAEEVFVMSLSVEMVCVLKINSKFITLMTNCPGLITLIIIMMTNFPGLMMMMMMMLMMALMVNYPGLTIGMPFLPSYSLLSEVSIKLIT